MDQAIGIIGQAVLVVMGLVLLAFFIVAAIRHNSRD
jgi:hypothetical protein